MDTKAQALREPVLYGKVEGCTPKSKPGAGALMRLGRSSCREADVFSVFCLDNPAARHHVGQGATVFMVVSTSEGAKFVSLAA